MKFDTNKIYEAVAATNCRQEWESDSKGADNSAAKFFQYPKEVPVGHYFLCDCIGNTIDLCRATKRAFRNSAGRLVKCKVIQTLIPDCHQKFGTALNGCWIIPSNCK